MITPLTPLATVTLGTGGEFGGRDQDMYALGARFLEALRLYLKKPKSRKRKEIEDEAGGRPDKQPFLGVDADGKFWVPKDAMLVKRKDAAGRTVVQVL